MKPLFYLLAKHGPWEHHVRLKTIVKSEAAEHWLLAQGRKYAVDFEILVEPIWNPMSKQSLGKTITGPGSVARLEPILFLTTYKMPCM